LFKNSVKQPTVVPRENFNGAPQRVPKVRGYLKGKTRMRLVTTEIDPDETEYYISTESPGKELRLFLREIRTFHFLLGDPGSIMGIQMHTCLFESDPDIESKITRCILVYFRMIRILRAK